MADITDIKIPRIASHADLKRRIAQLESLRETQETALKENLRIVYDSLSPAELVRMVIDTLRNEQSDTSKTSGEKPKRSFLDQFSIGSNISNFAVQKVLDYVYRKYEGKLAEFTEQLKERLTSVFEKKTDDSPPEEPEEDPASGK